MNGRKVALEVAKWVYGWWMGAMVFLFFCLVLDFIGYWIGGGWNPLLGQWPIFSGTLSAVFYDAFWRVLLLMLGLACMGRLVIWNRVPGLLGFLVKHPD
jgi:hypothetical protein